MCELITTSADLLNVVKSVALSVLALILAWGMIYGVLVIRYLLKIVKDARIVVKEAKEGVLLFKEKAESGAYLLKLVSQGIHKVADMAENRKKKKKSSTAKKKTVKNKK